MNNVKETIIVSIHALLAECDAHERGKESWTEVSIHALLAECDFLALLTIHHDERFNPRTPCGVRPVYREDLAQKDLFQSTHSLRSATGYHGAGF